jgi:hypothetical protein
LGFSFLAAAAGFAASVVAAAPAAGAYAARAAGSMIPLPII